MGLPLSQATLLGVRATSEAQIIRATLVDHSATEIRSNRAATRLEDCQPATDLTERVVHGITDVEPEELSAVVVRIVIKRRTRDVRANLLNALLVHIGVEDVRNLVGGDVIGGVNLPSVAVRGGRLDVGINLLPVVAAEREAGKLQINHVVEPSERTLDTERSDKLARGGIADVLTEISVVTEQIAARLRAGDQTEDGNAILLTEGIVTSTIADKLNTQNIKEILRELGGRSWDCVASRAVVQSVRNGRAVDGSGLINSLAHITSNELASDTEELCAAAVIKDGLGQLGKLIDSLANLSLNLERSLQIVQADARSLIALGLQLPSAKGLTKREAVRNRIATSNIVRIAEARRSRDVRPGVFEVTRENALNRDFRQGRTHSEGELANTDEATPRAVN